MIEEERKITGIVEEIGEIVRISDNPKAPFTIRITVEGQKKSVKPDWDKKIVQEAVKDVKVGDKVKILEIKEDKYWNIVGSEIVEKNAAPQTESPKIVENKAKSVDEEITFSSEIVEKSFIEANNLKTRLKERNSSDYIEVGISDLADQIRRTFLSIRIKK